MLMGNVTQMTGFSNGGNHNGTLESGYTNWGANE